MLVHVIILNTDKNSLSNDGYKHDAIEYQQKFSFLNNVNLIGYRNQTNVCLDTFDLKNNYEWERW